MTPASDNTFFVALGNSTLFRIGLMPSKDWLGTTVRAVDIEWVPRILYSEIQRLDETLHPLAKLRGFKNRPQSDLVEPTSVDRSETSLMRVWDLEPVEF